MNAPFAQPGAAVLADLGVRPEVGLTDAEVAMRRARHGPNRLPEQQPRNAWAILLDQFRSLIVALLLAAVILSAVTADWLEAVAIGVVILVNAAIGFGSELRAVRSMEALRRLGEAGATVRRDGAVLHIPAEELLPGDVVLLEAGDVVTADLRIIDASRLRADESTLTGESVPVDKTAEPVAADTVLAERRCMLYKGTGIARGTAEGVVCAIGMDTELGRITALMAAQPDEGLTPLERRLGRLGRRLVWLTLAIAVVVAGVGLLGGTDPALIVKTSIALAVAAVPEGLPIVATLALARGMWRMATHNALVNRLAAVETLGATTVIATDKTGTLTENRMTVRRIATSAGDVELTDADAGTRGVFRRADRDVDAAADPELLPLLETGLLCSNASWGPADAAEGRVAVGEPMEAALLVAGDAAGLDAETLRGALPEVREIAFETGVNMMATCHRAGDAVRVAVKGAPEAVLAACTHVRVGGEPLPLDDAARNDWLARNETLADAGLRILALAEKTADSADADPYAGLTLLGLAGLVDPPRTEVRAAIDACQDAGVRVVMVTGDQPATAKFVAGAVGLAGDGRVVHGRDLAAGRADESHLGAAIFARVSPEQKLDLVRLYQQHGEVVAMLGDGVNDAPALESADIGVAMGRRGTDVAREAADMVLRDDSFTSIVTAIKQGRVIFDNIRSFIRYLVSCNLSEIIVVLLGVMMQTPLPILPLQILFLNLVTDVFPALAIGLGEGDPRIMERSPRDPREPLLTRRHWIEIGVWGSVIAVAVLAALLVSLYALGLDEQQAVTVSFLTLAFAQLWHVFNMRAPASSPLSNQVTRNKHVWLALILCTGLIIAAVYVPWLAVPMDTADPGRRGWLVVGVLSLLPTVLIQAWLSFGPRPRSRRAPLRLDRTDVTRI